MAVTATIDQRLTVVETLGSSAIPSAPASNTKIEHTAFNRLGAILNATSTPKADAVVFEEVTFGGGGTATIDFTNCKTASNQGGGATMSGKKLVAFLLVADAGNAAAVTVAPGASNGYAMIGTGNEIDLQAGEASEFSVVSVASSKPTVSGSAKTLDLAGTSGDSIQCLFVFGTP